MQILERHLVISDIPYTMERIKLLNGNGSEFNQYGARREVALPTQRDILKIAIEETNDHSMFSFELVSLLHVIGLVIALIFVS